ncbi:MAG: hypothetical protein ABI823_13845, partial [Bryobacteraceae bacterium]
DEVSRHLDTCAECSGEIELLRSHAQMLQALRSPADMEVRAGFYARVMDRIDAQRPADGWMSLLQSAFAFRIALASVVLTLLVGTYLFTNEEQPPAVAQQQELRLIHEDQMPMIEVGQPRDPDSVLVSLASYREQ